MSADQVLRGSGPPFRLRVSLRVIGVPLAAGVFGIGVFAMRESWIVVGILVALIALGYGLILERRLDFDSEKLRLTPVLPIRARQKIRWDDMGSPRVRGGYGGIGSLTVPLSSSRYWFAGVIPMRRVVLTAVYQTAPGERAFTAWELAALIEQHRLSTAT